MLDVALAALLATHPDYVAGALSSAFFGLPEVTAFLADAVERNAYTIELAQALGSFGPAIAVQAAAY